MVKITRFPKIHLDTLTHLVNTVKYTCKNLRLIVEFYIVINSKKYHDYTVATIYRLKVLSEKPNHKRVGILKI